MAKAVVIAVVLSSVVFGGAAAFLLVAHSEPSTQALDADLAKIRTQIKAANDENAQYAVGAIKVLILIRRQILQTTEAMIEAKRASLIRRIELQYIVEGHKITPASDAKMSQIKSDIDKETTKLSKDLEQASRYSGGLMQTMSLIAAVTDRVTIAQLELAYYSAKYGTAVPVAASSAFPGAVGAPGKIVGDKHAL
jgi:hypothetical protein